MSRINDSALETSLVRAAHDPRCRAQFYRDLLAAQVVIIPSTGEAYADWQQVQVEFPLRTRAIRWRNRPFLPLFSSLPRLMQVAPRPGPFAIVAARQFLESTRGSDLVLNPGSGYSKELPSQEVIHILDGTIWSEVLTDASPIVLTTPAIRPDKLIDILIVTFSRLPSVLRAWVALAHEPQRSRDPYLLVGIQASGEWEHISAVTADMIVGLDTGYPRTELYRVSGSRGMSSHFLRQRPFYQAHIGAR